LSEQLNCIHINIPSHQLLCFWATDLFYVLLMLKTETYRKLASMLSYLPPAAITSSPLRFRFFFNSHTNWHIIPEYCCTLYTSPGATTIGHCNMQHYRIENVDNYTPKGTTSKIQCNLDITKSYSICKNASYNIHE
jgi:hypothetical protein